MKKHIKKLRKKINKSIHPNYTPILAALVVCILLGAGYFGFKYWNGMKADVQRSIELQNETQKELEIQMLQQDLQTALKEKSRDEEIEALRKQLLDLQNKPASTKVVENTTPTPTKETTADIVREWSPRVAHIECRWFNSSGTVFARSNGSATIVNFTGIGIKAVTSKHILSTVLKVLPKECELKLSGGATYTVTLDKSNTIIADDKDRAYISLPADATLNNIAQKKLKTCSSVDAGDSLLILGYPKIGSKTGLTVTEGIVSGSDDTYFITSAKIDKGNSGGAAILVKESCYLGIPTASVVGQIESLGRILKASYVIGN